jgi:hypothetical protein
VTCTDCLAVSESPGWRTYNPACIHCGARYIKNIRTSEERRRVLGVWLAQGHAEKRIRELVAQPGIPIQEPPRKGKA